MKKIVIFLIFIVAALKADNIVIVGNEWCPYNCSLKNSLQGYIVDIAKEIFKKHEHTVEYKLLPWARCIREFEAGVSQGLIGASKTKERLQKGYVYPNELAGVAKNMFYVKASDPWKYEGVASLESVAVGIIKDYSYGDEVDAYFIKNVSDPTKVQMLSGDEALSQNFKKLMLGRVDVVIEDRGVGSYELKKLELEKEIVSAGGLTDDELYLAFSPKSPKSKEYAKMFDEGIVALRKNGKLKEILAKYGLEDWKK